MEEHKHYKLWLVWKGAFQKTDKNTLELKEYWNTERQRQRAFKKLMRLIRGRYAGKFWQVRIYSQPGNNQVYIERANEQSTENTPRPQ
jgi:hypothetical protein